MSSLKIVDFVDSNGRHLDGLVSVASPKDATSSHERAILEDASRFEHISYVYFRRFSGDEGRGKRSSQIAAYVVDNSKQHLTPEVLAELHHKLWLHGAAPLVYVAWPTKVDILSCARKPDFWKKNTATRRYAPAETLQTAANISDELGKRRRLSAFRLAEGTFWDEPDNQKLAKDDAAAHRSLIQAIVDVDKELDGAKKPMRRRLLVLTILIKYLEDRRVFPAGLFGKFHKGARSFLDILRDGTVESVTKLLKHFETKFNGDVFALGNDESELTSDELQQFAKLVEAKTLGRQKHFWKLFSFEHIPVEVISRLYQRFVTGHGAVYTPPFLAALLLDQVMPYDSMTGKEKVFDPACGSGIFLVGAFKRLVTHWRSRHRWQRPTAEQLKAILLQSIYGVEMESAAVDLTAFSLSLAICDALHPDAIWKDLRFEKLRERNLREGDFFDTETTNSSSHPWPGKFDVIVGNPPFESKLTPAAIEVDSARTRKEPKLPDKQTAYLFLEQSLRSLTPGGSLCLIQPHGLLYNSNPVEFRRHLMSLARLDSILDFVSMRGMYEGADPKTVAWHAVNEPVAEQPVNHLTFRRTYSASERIAFEIDHYDWHSVARDSLGNASFWKAGLLGGGRLYEMSDRISKMPTLKTWLTHKMANDWKYGEGFNVGSDGNPCDFLTGHPYLPTEELTANGVGRVEVLAEDRFEATRCEELYDPPLIVLKEHSSLPMALWNQSRLTFRHSIIGIHAPIQDEEELRSLYERLKQHLPVYQFCLVLLGLRALTGKATAVNKSDIDGLPFPSDSSELDLSFWEEAVVDDTLRYMSDFVRLGQESLLLRRTATDPELLEYSSLYVRMLGSLYRNLKAAEAVRLNGLIAQPFYFGDKPDVSWLGEGCEDALHRLVYDQSRESLRTVRVVRYYEGNVILIVKPDRLRYWIRSTSIRDADDTLVDLREQGW